MRAQHQDAETVQDSNYSRAMAERRYVAYSPAERSYLKRQAHRANRRQARTELRKTYFNQETYITW